MSVGESTGEPGPAGPRPASPRPAAPRSETPGPETPGPETPGPETPSRGRLIVLEGGEGSGKSTQAALLASARDAVCTREPGGTATGERVRALLLDPALPALDERAETLLMLAARAQHVAEVIEPALSRGIDVICDRFSGSTLAYQGYGRGLPISELAGMSNWASAGLRPDRVILLAIPLHVAGERLGNRHGSDRMEAEGGAFFRRVAEGFAFLAASEPELWRVVDGGGTVEEVAIRVADAAS